MNKINFENLPSTNTPLSAENLNLLQDNIEDAIDGIIESGSNANGNWIKFADGTMICYGNREPSLTINVAWGNLYRSETFNIAYPVNFYNEPSFNIMMRGGTSAFILNWNPASDFKTGTGEFVVVRADQRASSYYPMTWMAIGRWK